MRRTACSPASSSGSSTLPRTNPFNCPLITSSFSCTIFSDRVCFLLLRSFPPVLHFLDFLPCSVIDETVDFPVEQIRTRILSFRAEETDESLNIADAEVIVCVGNGLKGADALPRYRALAEKLGGKLACSRPVFDRGLLPYKLVVGQSGVVVKPRVYLAFGVSGAINHVTGFTDSDLVIAVNSDPDAPIFHYCDYGLVADMDETCDAMLRAME